MYAHNVPIRLARTLAPHRFAAGALVALTLLTAACSNDSASRITAPSLSASMSANASQSAGAIDFTVLAYAKVTCTDGKITGDVGTFLAPPTGSVTKTRCPITGTVDIGDAAAVAAYKAFVAEYIALTPAPATPTAPAYCNVTNILTGSLAGVSLSPGTYCVSGEAKTGVLTLTGNGTWTFLVVGALTGNSFSVVMADGGDPCNVTWWVQAAATMTDSHFIGTILAGAGITLTGGTFNGNAWAGASGSGDVTITGTAVTGCAGRKGNGKDKDKEKCNQGVGNGSEGCDPGNSNNHNTSNDELGGTPGDPGRQGGHH
jgi:Ice-binding-like